MEGRFLTQDFVIEIIKCCLTDPKVLMICKKHIKYHYLFTESQKKVVKFIFDSFDITNTAPTIGVIGQSFSTDQEVIALLSKVKKISIDKEQIPEILDGFEAFIIDARFRVLYEQIGDLHNAGKQKEAIKLLATESIAINNFRIKDKFYTAVFEGFQERQHQRELNKNNATHVKLTSGVHQLDDFLRGGFNKGTSLCILARSGAGKSTYLRWLSLCNARLGKRVVHFQAEGSQQECLDAYDAGWTSINLHDIEIGILPDEKKVKIYKAQRDIIATGGEIYVYASESFDSMSMHDCRDILVDIISIYGAVDLVVFDYLEIFTVKGAFGNNEAGERKRREEIANKITNMATEFNCLTATATQANDITADKYNNPEFVLTRSHISEFKGVVKPFSYFFSLNQTDDEYESEILRLHIDKFRKYKKPKKPIFIYQSRSNSRFYDAKKTIAHFYVPPI